jgi:hypothetical protein
MILKYEEYKNYLIENIDFINEILDKYYYNIFKIKCCNNNLILIKKDLDNEIIFNENENSIYLIDEKVKYYIDIILLTEKRESSLKRLTNSI